MRSPGTVYATTSQRGNAGCITIVVRYACAKRISSSAGAVGVTRITGGACLHTNGKGAVIVVSILPEPDIYGAARCQSGLVMEGIRPLALPSSSQVNKDSVEQLGPVYNAIPPSVSTPSSVSINILPLAGTTTLNQTSPRITGNNPVQAHLLLPWPGHWYTAHNCR